MIEYDIWPHQPDTTGEPVQRVFTEADVLNIAQARAFITWPWPDPVRVLNFRFTFLTEPQTTAAKRFFSDKGGAAEAFLLPSWERDITLAADPAPGAQYLEVVGSNWLDSYPIHHPDGPGRYMFAFCPTNGFWASRIVEVSEASPTTTTLELETPIPWTPAADAIIGWLLVVRFTEDEQEWTQYSPNTATAEMSFTTTRQRILKEEEDQAADGIALEASAPLKFASAEVGEPPMSDMTVAYAYGPKNYRVTQNANYEQSWAGWVGTSTIRLGRYEPGDIEPPDDAEGFPCPLFATGTAPTTTTHLSLSFDQNGYEAFAWQHDATTAKIRRLVNGIIRTYTFPGIDPILFFNGSIAIEARLEGESEIVCYYRKPGYALLFARIMRDNFGIEYIAAGVPFIPIKLLDVIFDRDARNYTVRYVDVGWRTISLRSQNYPVPPPIPPDPYVAFYLDPEEAPAALYISPSSNYTDSIVRSPTIHEDAPAVLTITPASNYEFASSPGFLDPEFSIGTLTIADKSIYFDAVVKPPGIAESGAATLTIRTDSEYKNGIADGGLVAESGPATLTITSQSSYAP